MQIPKKLARRTYSEHRPPDAARCGSIASYFVPVKKTLFDFEDNTTWLTDHQGETCTLTLMRTLSADGYNTFAAPCDISADGLAELGFTHVKQLASSSLTDGVLTLNFTDALSVEAGTPYLVRVSEDLVNPVFTAVSVSPATHITQTAMADLVPALGKTLVVGPEGDESNPESVLFLAANNTLFHPEVINNAEASDDESYIKGFRAYFRLKGDALLAPVRTIRLDLGTDEATALLPLPDSAQDASNAIYSSDGSNAIYSVDGRRLPTLPSAKGIYIVNGKKVIIF